MIDYECCGWLIARGGVFFPSIFLLLRADEERENRGTVFYIGLISTAKCTALVHNNVLSRKFVFELEHNKSFGTL